MSSDAAPRDRSERVVARRLWWVGPLAVVAAVVANIVFTQIAVRLFGISPEFLALTPGPIASFTAIGVVPAVIVFALIARSSTHPISRFRRIALVALLLSFLPNLALFFVGDPILTPLPIILLMLTHVVAAAVSVLLLTALTRDARA